MSSLTQKMKKIARKKSVKQGRSRKRETAAGTTPRFPVHIETAPDASLPMPPGTDPKEKIA